MSARDNPFEGLDRLFDRLSRQLEEVAREWDTERFGLESAAAGTMGIDLADRGDEFVVTADVPGFENDEIDLHIIDDTLHIRAEHDEEAEEREETYLQSEREHRALHQSVTVPEPIDEDGATATAKNGVLTVHLPRIEPSRETGRRIEIE